MSLVRKQFRINDDTVFDCDIFAIARDDGPEQFWFNGRDVAEFLGYRIPNKAIIDHVNAEWKCPWSALNGNLGTTATDGVIVPSNWRPHTVFVSEAGLYALATRSEKPEAVKFQKWVMDDVLPALRRTGRFPVNRSDGSEPMDTTPIQVELGLLKKDLEIQEVKRQKMEIEATARDKEHALQMALREKDFELRVADFRRIAEIDRLELHFRYTFQTESAQIMGRAAIEQYARRRAEQEQREEVKSIVDDKYRMIRNMDDIDPLKVNNLGIVWHSPTDEYKIIRQQWGTTLKTFCFVRKSVDSEPVPLDESRISGKRRDAHSDWIVQGEMMRCAHGVNVWNRFIDLQTEPLLFGLRFSDTSVNRFGLMREDELREHYRAVRDDKNNDPVVRYTNKRYEYYRKLHAALKFEDENDCVSRCLVTDIWQLRRRLIAFIDDNSFESIERSVSEAGRVSDAASVIADTIANEDYNNGGDDDAALALMRDRYPQEAETLRWRRACERYDITKREPSSAMIPQHLMMFPSSSGDAAVSGGSIVDGTTPNGTETKYTVQTPNTTPRRCASNAGEYVSVGDGEESDRTQQQVLMTRYFHDLENKQQSRVGQTTVGKYTK